MILLSGYEEPVGEDSVSSFVDIAEDSPFFEREIDGVPGCVALEYMAQTTALFAGITRRRLGLGPAMGFVLGSRRLETRIPAFRRGSRYGITAKCTYQDEELGSFDCEIRDGDGNVVAQGTLKVFLPGDVAATGDMEEFP